MISPIQLKDQKGSRSKPIPTLKSYSPFMCGISLVISTQGSTNLNEYVQSMNAKVAHRGPDGEGYYEGENFAMGHRRLSIVDLSSAGLQPMRKDEDVIIFNGMIYNYLELRSELIELGHTFHTETDTEVLLAACQQWGTAAFQKLNGMWAFALYRKRENEILLCRDYFGIKPLYYTVVDGLFAVGSEVKQFTSLPGFQPVLNKKAAVNFLVKGSLNYSEHTFFRGVKELRGGEYMIYNLTTHAWKIHKWYNLDEASWSRKVDVHTASKELYRLFGDSVEKRMRADVNIGSCLSGGIDSSSIVSYVHTHRLSNSNFKTVTSCYVEPGYDEQIHSDKISEVTGFHAEKVYPDLDRLLDGPDFDKMLYHHDQPFGGTSHYSEFSVFRAASRCGSRVMLSGQGADEYLCGYEDFFMTHVHKLLRSGDFGKAFRNIKGKAKSSGCSTFQLVKSYLKGVLWFPTVSLIKRMFGKTSYRWMNPHWRALAEEHVVEFSSGNIRKLSLEQVTTSSLPFQLHSEDRNSMMHGIESRLPFLDHRLVEYSISLPCDYKLKDGVSKWIFRESIPEIPAAIKQRKDKMGFVGPDEPWVRASHVRIRKELEEAVAFSGIFSPYLLTRFDKFIQGNLDFEYIYFRAIALYRFMKVFKMQLHHQKPAENTAPLRKALISQNIVAGLVSCSNFISDVNYC